MQEQAAARDPVRPRLRTSRRRLGGLTARPGHAWPTGFMRAIDVLGPVNVALLFLPDLPTHAQLDASGLTRLVQQASAVSRVSLPARNSECAATY